MVPRILLCLAFLSLSGCAYMMSRQTCNITSNPPGAAVYLVSSPDEQSGGTLLGTTPCQKWVQQGMTSGYLRADLAGHQSVFWSLPNTLRFTHQFELERSVPVQLSADLPTYPKDYVRAALDVLGKCDEAIASPRLLSGTAVAAANTANERLKLDYAGFRSSVLARALDGAIDELRPLGGRPVGGDNTLFDSRATARAQYLVDEIKQGLGVR